MSRPGDFGDKLWFKDEEKSREAMIEKGRVKAKAREDQGLKGNGARHALMAKWLHATFGEGVRYVDVAGGSG